MGPTPTYHPPKREGCEISVEHGLPLWAEPNRGYRSSATAPFSRMGEPLCEVT